MYDYACLMLKYEQPKFIKELQKQIPEEELYYGENGDEKENFGLEHQSHVTLCYGLENDVKFKDFQQYLYKLDDYKSIIVNISVFENDDFDVLKCDVKCPKANETNKKLMDNFKVHSDYPDYHAHMTIAYLKKGNADKYTKKSLDKIETLKPIEFTYSYFDGKGDKYEHYNDKDLSDIKENEINEAFEHFYEQLLKNNKDIDPEIQSFVNDNFWEMI